MHRTSKGGTYRLDRVFPGVGRIVRASGATTKGEFQKRNDLLTRLYEKGRLDLLTSIRDGAYSVTEVYAADREDNLARLTGSAAILQRPLWSTVETWVGPTPGPTRKRYAVSFAKLEQHLPAAATVGDIGRVEGEALSMVWGGCGTDWNHLRRAAAIHVLHPQDANPAPVKPLAQVLIQRHRGKVVERLAAIVEPVAIELAKREGPQVEGVRPSGRLVLVQ